MSFCVWGIASSGSRYVPAIVAQGCAARLLGTGSAHRQLPALARQQQQQLPSTFLHEFLNSNLPATSALCASQDHNLSNVGVEMRSVDTVEQLLENYPTYEVIYENSNGQIAELRSSQHMVANQKINWTYLNRSSHFTSPAALTKDDTKVQFAAIPANATVPKPQTTNATTDKNNEEKKQSNDDLVHVYETLKVDFPSFFIKSIDYRIYHPEIEFVNNIKGTTTKGIYPYVKQMAFLRTVGHLKFAYVKMDVLKITMHTQDNTVKVRWRINGITGMKVLFNFWKFKFWKIRESLKESEVWHDGFSTYYVGKDGLVYKHVAEKMMPDDNVSTEKPKAGIPTKLASQLTFSSLD